MMQDFTNSLLDVSMVTSIPNVSKIGRFFDRITPEDDE